MKKLLLLGAFALLTTLFSCTADEYEAPTKNEIKKTTDPVADGPGDDIPPPPPPLPVDQ
ncbi:hypothetical protein EV144_103246 [Flavobacterium sp. 270]|uniref:hypothetical protein n=1 Tax=Flavobacterium sp. 270 TaxID=2512114 RepID=UPI0010EC99BC|nr:hypothetical protein [Flavobacterium sp. 270]TDW48729.1 hypothetical protein EV144_103246 [Flavobacterium sp. 270]